MAQLNGGTNNINYVTSQTVQIAGKKTEADLTLLLKESLAQTTTYLDGLGRTRQVVAGQASPVGGDVIQPIVYDSRGRVTYSYLPYHATTNIGQYRTDAQTGQAEFYNDPSDNIPDDSAPYAQTIFENAPMARVLEQGAPGLTWQPGGSTPRTIRTKQRANTSTEAIKKFTFDYTNQKPYCVGTYAAAEISVTETTDEHQAVTLTYVNSSGQIVARKSHAYNTSGDNLLAQSQNMTAGDGLQPAAAPAAAPITVPYFVTTYYVYDDFSNLRTVIQPEGVKELAVLTDWNTGITATFLAKWCFQYKYDALQRLIEKQVPGGGGTYLVYNTKDQLIATATSRDISLGAWQLIKYDALGRPVLTGYKILNLSPATLQSNVNAQPASALLYESRTTADQGYTLTQAYPTLAATEVQTVTFYDDYNYPNLANLPFVPENGVTTAFDRLTGSMTGHLERVLGSTQWIVTKNFYDAKEQPIQSRTLNFLNGETRATTALDFLGRPKSTLLTHSANGTTNTIRNTFSYDHAGRGLLVTQQMDYGLTTVAAAVIVSSSAYDVLGKLVDKKLHSTDNGLNFLQSVDYQYNIRGWLTSINDRNLLPNADGTDVEPDLFGLELKYDDPNQAGLLGGQAQYNGNVSQALWRTRNAATGNTLRGYSYQYDLLNRLKAADYATYEVSASTGLWEWGKTKSDYSVSGINYTDNGNILNLNRRGRLSALTVTTNPTFGDLDKLKYKYDGNQLMGVDDAAAASVLPHDFEDNGNKYQTSGLNEYGYDASGNLLRDANKSISRIEYNQLNQPTLIVFANRNTISFVYTADGQKVRKVVTPALGTPVTTDYVGGFVYEDGQLKFGPMPEGRVLRNAGSGTFAWKYEYHLKDHLGNLRFAFRDYGGSAYQRGITAGMEPADASKEEQTFRRVAATRTRDAAHAHGGRYVARLNAAKGTGLGPSIRWAVQPGDSIGAEVYGRYERPARAVKSTHRPRLLLLPGVALPAGRPALGEAAAPGVARGATPQLSLNLALVPGAARVRALAPPAETLPQAYLELRLFARDSQLLAVRRQPLTTAAGNQWQHLSTGLTADSAGYAEARLVNESAEPAAFDDMALRPVDTGNIQENHYDPFGLNLVGIEALTAYPSKYQFNGQEKQEEFGLNWNDHGARFYDPQLGRWHVADPMADAAMSWSPYRAFFNNPLSYTDPSGMLEGWVEDEKERVWLADIHSQKDVDNAGIKAKYIGETFDTTDKNGNHIHGNDRGGIGVILDAPADGTATVTQDSKGIDSKSDSNPIAEQNAGFLAMATGDGSALGSGSGGGDGTVMRQGSSHFENMQGRAIHSEEVLRERMGGSMQDLGNPGAQLMLTRGVLEGYGGELIALKAVKLASSGIAAVRMGATVSSHVPEIGGKLSYLFGKATGNAHNIERSTGMLRQLQSIGIFDNAIGNAYLRAHLGEVLNNTKGVLQTNGRYMRESLLMGPNGSLKMESIWEGNKLITATLMGGK